MCAAVFRLKPTRDFQIKVVRNRTREICFYLKFGLFRDKSELKKDSTHKWIVTVTKEFREGKNKEKHLNKDYNIICKFAVLFHRQNMKDFELEHIYGSVYNKNRQTAHTHAQKQKEK